jgi:hypothetical protein
MLDQKRALELFEYRDGKIYCKSKTNKKSNKLKIGDQVGSINASEYLRTRINYKEYFVHKIIFLMHHGYTPQIVDHIDGDTLNNNISNLRAANLSQNQHNRDIDKRNKSGYKNVSFCKRTNKWLVGISVKRKNIFLGRFDDIELADLVATEGRFKYHGEYARRLVCSR